MNFTVVVPDKVCQRLATGQWFSPGTRVSSTNKTDHHNITEILLKMSLNTITLTLIPFVIQTIIGLSPVVYEIVNKHPNPYPDPKMNFTFVIPHLWDVLL